jgi:hypothetical protein
LKARDCLFILMKETLLIYHPTCSYILLGVSCDASNLRLMSPAGEKCMDVGVHKCV